VCFSAGASRCPQSSSLQSDRLPRPAGILPNFPYFFFSLCLNNKKQQQQKQQRQRKPTTHFRWIIFCALKRSTISRTNEIVTTPSSLMRGPS
jgi:hypothetical protein